MSSVDKTAAVNNNPDETLNELVADRLAENQEHRSDLSSESAEKAVRGFEKLLHELNSLDLKSQNRECFYLGEKADLLGFDRASGAVLIARQDLYKRMGETREAASSAGQITDSQGRKYEELNLGEMKLYRDGDGRIFSVPLSENGMILQELNGICSFPLHDRRLSIEKKNEQVQVPTISTAIVRTSEIQVPDHNDGTAEFLDRLAEISSESEVLPSAIAQSNDYARNHQLKEKIQDGFRTAGQLREFAPDGGFAATDRAATVVDRTKDQKLNEIIDDAKKQFAHLPEREKARALADYVNKIMGPQDGDEQALDSRYRKLMQDNAGKQILLSEFAGSGACTQRALLLKVLADEMGLDSAIVRGNGGSHVWNTFKFSGGRKEIFDTRARVYGVESSDMHNPSQPGLESINGRDVNAGQKLTVEGKEWTVKGYVQNDGSLLLARSEEKNVNPTETSKYNQGKELRIGETYKLPGTNGRLEEWGFAGRNDDGTLKFARSEKKAFARKELAESILELAAPANPDMQFLQNNWKTLVEDNPKLSDKQKKELKASLELLDGHTKIADFRKLVTEIGRLGASTSTDAPTRITALSSIAHTMANYPEAVNIPVERVIGASVNLAALTQVAESFAQSAPHESAAPLDIDGSPDRRGDGYEHAASQALQQALKDKATVDRLIQQGKLPPGEWVFVPASKGSVADHLKIDGMLVDMKTGKAVFIDFAMHGTGRTPYGRLVEKLAASNTFRDGTPRHPFALTLDLDTIGWDPNTGTRTGTIDASKILERVGSYMKGTQAQDLGLTSVRQAPPTVYDIARLRTDLGGQFPSFAPINSKLEADVMSRETGRPVKTTQEQLAEIESRLGRSARPELKIFGNSAASAANAADDVASGADYVDRGLRAAVEAQKYGALDRVYGTGRTVPDVRLHVGQDAHADLPDKYKGRKYIGITGDDTVASNGGAKVPTEVRIYENGDVVVRPGGGKFQCIGNLREVGERLARELQRNGIDPKNFSSQIKELGRAGKNFNSIAADIQSVNEHGSMTPEQFWMRHKELRLLADGVQHSQANQRAAQEARPVYEARQRIDSSPSLAKLPDREKEAIAQKFVELDKAGHKRLSFEDVRNILQVEKIGVRSPEAIEAIRFQKAIGKEANSWSAADIKTKYESARAAQAKDFSSVKDLSDVYRLQQLQTDLKVDAPSAQALLRLKKALPEASNADLMDVKQMYDSLKNAGLRSINLDAAAAIFAKHGKLGDAEIVEMVKLSASLKSAKPEELAGLALRNIKVEKSYGVDAAVTQEIKARVIELVKAGVPSEQAHEAATSMILKKFGSDPAVDNTRRVEIFGTRPGTDPVVDSLALETEYKQFRKWSTRGRTGLDASSGGLYQSRVNQLINRGLPETTDGKANALLALVTDFSKTESRLRNDPLLKNAEVVADPALENGGKLVFKHNGVEVSPVCRDATHAYLRSPSGDITKIPLAEMQIEMRVSAKSLEAAGSGSEAAKKAAREVSSTLFHELAQLDQLGTRIDRGKVEGVNLLDKAASADSVRRFMEREKLATDLSANFMQYELNGRRLADSQAVPHATPQGVDLRTPLSEIKGQKVVTAMEPDGRLRIYVIDSRSTVREIEGDKARELVDKAFDKVIQSLDERIKTEKDEAVKQRLMEERQKVIQEKERYARDTEFRRSVNHELGKRLNSVREGIGRATGPAVTVLFLTTVALEMFRRESHGSSDFLDINVTGS